MNAAAADGPPCNQCGAPLARVPYVRDVTCAYCGARQPNPGCLPVGHEVLVTGGKAAFFHALTLARVTACSGPDDVTVEIDEQGATPRHERLEAVVPVLPARGNLVRGMPVYVRGLAEGWMRTWAASDLADGSAKVKHDNPAFQDAFFDRTISELDLRVDARPAERPAHKRHAAWLAQLQSDPLGVLVKSFFFIVALTVVSVVLWLVVVGLVRC